MNYYTFHSGDYLRDTSHLSLIEDAIYRRCLDWYYTNESPLPNDFKKIARLIRASDFLADVEQVVSEFFILGENGWSQSRCDAEIGIYHEKAQKARENGQKGGRPKTKTKPNHNPQETDSVILANQTLTESKANQEPITNNQEPLLNNNNAREEKTESNLYVSPSRRLFKITQDWKPEPNTWAETLKVSQHLVKLEQFTDYTLAEFIRTNLGKEEKTEHDWQRFYVNALARGYIKSAPDNQKEKKQNQHIYQPQEKNVTPENSASATEFVAPKKQAISEEEKARRKAFVQEQLKKAGV